MSISRRELFGLFRRAPAPAPAAPAPAAPAPAPDTFSLDAFYRARGPVAPLPVFPVRTAVGHEPPVIDSSCLATRAVWTADVEDEEPDV